MKNAICEYYSNVTPKPVDWLWYPYIPFGKLTVIQGDPGEGKSTCSINLAMSLADEGNRVVLLDGDLRNQTIGRILGTSQKAHGLMECMKNPNLPLMECLRVMPGTNLTPLPGVP